MSIAYNDKTPHLSFTLELPGNFPLPFSGADKVGMQRSMASQLEPVVQDNFISLGGRSYWSEAADSTLADPSAAGVVNVRQRGVSLHLHGGTVLPGKGISSYTGQPTKYLAIPAADEAKGRAPGFFHGNLRFTKTKKPYPHLRGLLFADVLPAEKEKKGKRHSAKPKSKLLFLLVDQVTIKKTPRVLPPEQDMLAALRRGFDSYIYLKLKRH